MLSIYALRHFFKYKKKNEGGTIQDDWIIVIALLKKWDYYLQLNHIWQAFPFFSDIKITHQVLLVWAA